MPSDYTVELAGHSLEYLDESHQYLVDGVIVPSITSLCKQLLGDRYPGVPKETLRKAADRGTAIHEAVEKYCKTGLITCDEAFGFRTVVTVYGISVLDNEVPVILFDEGKPIAAGRLDLVIRRGGRLGLADIKSTSKLDKEYLALQLHLYLLAYEQSYGERIEYLAGIHLRGDTARLVNVPIDREFINEMIRRIKDAKELQVRTDREDMPVLDG